MPALDISHDQHAEAKAALDAVSVLYRGYLDVIEAQSIALRQDNMRLVARLSERIDRIIAELRTRSSELALLYSTVGARTTDGPRAQELRDLMTAVAAEAALAQAAQRDLATQMITRRNQVAKELDRLDGAKTRTNSPYSRQPALVDASA